MLVFGGSQSVRRLDAAMAEAVADLVTRCAVVHLTGPRLLPGGRAAARVPAAPSSASATCPSPSCATTWRPRWPPRTCSWAGPARPRWRRPPRPACPWSSCPTRTRPRTRRPTPVDARGGRGGRHRGRRGARWRRPAGGRRRSSSTSACRGWPLPPARWPGPGRRTRRRPLLVSLVEGASLPDPESLDAQTRALA